MKFSTPLNAARIVFVCISALLGISLAVGYGADWAWLGAFIGLAFSVAIIGLDASLRNLSIRRFSHGTLGLLIGVLCAWLITRIGLFDTGWMEKNDLPAEILQLATYLAFGFIGMMLALRSKRDEFSLIIPYVRFRQESVQDSPLLVDADVIIDGRLIRLCETGFVGGTLVVPQFVLDEIQFLADHRSDSIRQQRGRRGLDCLAELQDRAGIEVIIQDDPTSISGSDSSHAKLIAMARLLGARIITVDDDLTSVARLQNVPVLSLSELVACLRAEVTPGDELELPLVKEGKDNHQAIGFLPDGTMIVVNEAVSWIGTTQVVRVAGTTQTSAGRLIFAELKKRTQ